MYIISHQAVGLTSLVKLAGTDHFYLISSLLVPWQLPNLEGCQGQGPLCTLDICPRGKSSNLLVFCGLPGLRCC